MDYSVKSIGSSGATKLNSFGKNSACQPLRDDAGLYKVKFGNGESKMMNDQGDSFKRTGQAKQDSSFSFGQKFVTAAKELAEKFKGKDALPIEICEDLIPKIYPRYKVTVS